MHTAMPLFVGIHIIADTLIQDSNLIHHKTSVHNETAPAIKPKFIKHPDERFRRTF